MSELKPRWWISWQSVMERDGGFALHSPWWVSGWAITEDGEEESIFVGAVRANTEDEAFGIIEAAYDKKAEDPSFAVTRRFCELVPEGDNMPWEHEGTRFPFQDDWMVWDG